MAESEEIMNELTIYHFADAHFDAPNQDVVLASLRAVYDKGYDDADLWVIAGDLFNGAVQNSRKSGFPELIRVIRGMMYVAPVVAVRGTPVHDVDGCYEVFSEIQADFPFVLLDPRENYCLSSEHGWVESYPDINHLPENVSLLIFGMPEPSREWFLAGREGLGREESNAAVVDELQKILTGWGAVRREWPDIPCLLIYHGAVAGARMSPNQVQRPGEIALGRDDLALVGANYCALGHFHEAQKAGELPAYYAGSCRYGDTEQWSESDRKGFNQIKLYASPNGIATAVERLQFEHLPPRKKIVTSWPIGPDEFKPDGRVKGYQVWLELQTTKQLAAELNEEASVQQLLDAGALSGSRITVAIKAEETLRAAEVQRAHSLRDKLQVWADNSDVETTAQLFEYVDELEREAREQGVIFQPMDIIFNRLRLRGATGILKGRGVDEVEFDLDKFDDGLIALVGDNGTGKTTLFENMHPFSQLLTRRGKLQDHFRLRDGFRDLIMTERIAGKKYRAFIQVDGANPTGACSYHLYQGGRPCSDNDRKDTYDENVGKLFGTADVFKRSAFVGQKANKQNPPLADMTKGEKKELFATLAGLEPIQFASRTAGDWAKKVEAEIVDQELKIRVAEEMLSGSSLIEDELNGLIIQRDEQAKALEELETSGKQLKADTELLREKVEANRRIAERIEEMQRRQSGLLVDIAELTAKSEEYNQAVQHRVEAEAIVGKAENLRLNQGRLTDERAKIQAEREQRLTEHRDRSETVAHKEKGLRAEKAEIDAKTSEIRQKKAGFVSKIDQIRAFLEKTVECPKCGHQFVPGSEEQSQELESCQKAVWELDKEIAAQEQVSTEYQQQIEALEYPPEPELPGFGDIEVKLNEISEQLKQLNVTEMRAVLQQAQEAQVRLEEMEKRRQQIKSEQDQLEVEIEDLNKQLDNSVSLRFIDKQRQLNDAENAYRITRDTLKSLEAQIEALRKQIDELGKKAGELLQLKTEVQGKQQQAADWRLLERAFGPDGVQALELDAMSPEIQQSANQLLQVAREANPSTPFDSLRIETTRIGGRGSDRRQIEDFLIWCHDTRDDSVTELAMISGGEEVWVREALYEAFAVRRAKTRGLKFSTALADEADGALDPQARLAYFRMLEAAHRESGRRHTVVITQSEAARDLIPQQVRLEDLVVRGKE